MKNHSEGYGLLAKLTITLSCAALMLPCFSRSYKFRLKSGTAESKNSGYYYDKVVKKDSFLAEIGSSSKGDSLDEIEIRAATLLKDIRSKKSVVNDVATLKFTPTGRRQMFIVECGAALADGVVEHKLPTLYGGDRGSERVPFREDVGRKMLLWLIGEVPLRVVEK